MRTIIVGSRGSDLALTQTRHVMALFNKIHPETRLELRVIRTTGDNRPDASLAEIGGLGAFTREIETALLDGSIDMAVHSLKDLPTRQPAGLAVAAVAGRETPQDALISNADYTVELLPEGAHIGTSSLRRKAQLLALRPDLHIEELRGNVPTRLRRLREGHYDAIVMALAGLRRLNLHEEPGVFPIPMDIMLPAPGQGALALETRWDDTELISMLAPLHDVSAAVETQCERYVLEAFGGGCRAPLGALARVDGARISVSAFASDEDGRRSIRLERDGTMEESETLGRTLGNTLRHATRRTTTPVCANADDAPLQGRRIVVTRAEHQAASLTEKLKGAGAQVFTLPLIEIEMLPPELPPLSPNRHDWLVLTSVNALNAFQRLLQTQGLTLRDFSTCRVAAVGPTTALALVNAGLRVDIVPDSHVSDALAEAILAAESNPGAKNVLLPKSNLARPNIEKALSRAGMNVIAITCYKTVARPVDTETRAALVAFSPHLVCFFSPSAVAAYIDSNLPEILSPDIHHASIGPVTSEALRDIGLTPHLTASEQTEQTFLESVIGHFNKADTP